MLAILGEYRQNGLENGHLKAENFPYKLLYFSPGSKLLEPDSKYRDLIGNMPAFNCLYHGHYFSDQAKITQ